MLVIWAAVEFSGITGLAPGLSGTTNGVAVRVLRTAGSRLSASRPWAPPPKLD